MTSILELRNLRKTFELGPSDRLVAVRDVSLELARGETLALVGESGSGKTTIGRCALRTVEPTAGRVIFDGQDITHLGAGELRALRARMQMVFQDPFGSLNPAHTVNHQLERPLLLHGKAKRGKDAQQKIEELLATVGLNPPAEMARKSGSTPPCTIPNRAWSARVWALRERSAQR